MNILLDTHIFLWLAQGELGHIENIDYLRDGGNTLYISSLSIAEISIKVSIGKLKFDGDILDVLKSMRVSVLDFDAKSAIYLQTFPFHHRDPFDRMIISQAITQDYIVCSHDKQFKPYDCKLLSTLEK